MFEFIPEECYTYTPLNRPQIYDAYLKGETITGKAYIHDDKLYVTLGHEITATIPFEEATIYPFKYSKNESKRIPLQIFALHKKNVRIKIIEIREDGTIIASRKQNMLEVLEKMSFGNTQMCKVTGLSDKNVFCDIGDGLQGILNTDEIATTRVKKVSDFFKIGQTFNAKILSESNNFFNISYKDVFPKYDMNEYKVGDTLSVTIGYPVKKAPGCYFCMVTPQVKGIVEIPSWCEVTYGEKIETTIAQVGEVGLKLIFTSKK